MTKSGILAVPLLALLAFCSTAFAEGKIDPLLRIMAGSSEAVFSQMAPLGAESVNGSTVAQAIIKAEDGKAREAKIFIEGLGGTVRAVIGDIMTASIPLGIIDVLDGSPLIAVVEAAKPVTSKMNWARTPAADGGSGAAEVQAGTCTGCTGGYTGTNVIVGVVDSGIDCQHADFKNGAGATRIIAYWDQSIAGSGVSEITGSSGTEYTGSALSDGSCASSPDSEGHGTHVTGIAAGSNSTYTGVASGSSIIVVKYSVSDTSSSGNFSTRILEGVDYIFKKADTLGMAAVANLSLGTSLGAHDGTSLLEQGLDALLVSGSAEKKGRAIVDAAGNENFMTSDPGAATLGGIHGAINVASGTDVGYEIDIRNSASAVSFGGVVVDFWLDSASTCTVKVEGYNATTGAQLIPMSFVSYGAATATAADGSVSISLSYAETAASGKKHGTATINRLNDSISSSILDNYYFYFFLSGTCSGNAWLYPDYTSIADFTKVQQIAPASVGFPFTYVAGDSNLTITIPATASKVITVGSYMDRASWVDINGTTYNQTTYGTCGGTGGTNLNVSLFSSLGPTANSSDLQKPDITAPGEPIISTLSSSVSATTCSKGDLTHFKEQGTSMSSPHVAGAVALMFQKNNCLTSSDAKTHLRNSATADSSTGSSLPNYIWGYGKLNSAAVMNLFSADASCYTPTPTPSTTSSGCSLLKAEDGGVNSVAALAACLVICCMVFGLGRAKENF